jgi:hypothetical protein
MRAVEVQLSTRSGCEGTRPRARNMQCCIARENECVIFPGPSVLALVGATSAAALSGVLLGYSSVELDTTMRCHMVTSRA